MVHLFFDFFLRIFLYELTEACHFEKRYYVMIKHKLKQMTVFVKKSIALKKFYPTVLLQYILIPHTVAIIAFYFPAPMPICSPDTVEAYNIIFLLLYVKQE